MEREKVVRQKHVLRLGLPLSVELSYHQSHHNAEAYMSLSDLALNMGSCRAGWKEREAGTMITTKNLTQNQSTNHNVKNLKDVYC